MSVATELPPVVFIPERARAARRPKLMLVPVEVPAGSAPAPATIIPVHAAATPMRVGSQSATAPLRLTRRGVVALWLCGAVLGALMLVLGYASWHPSDAGAAPVGPVSVVRVEPGDTLWSIAERVAPGRDPRNVVADLRARNHLSGVDLTPGQVLSVS